MPGAATLSMSLLHPDANLRGYPSGTLVSTISWNRELGIFQTCEASVDLAGLFGKAGACAAGAAGGTGTDRGVEWCSCLW
ncbi:hypothetical protein GCM10010353_69340 [Streptomyces chryseus]|nr:hypothetical protein GCM10010353_69340 [Streptomyces chryseus]